MSEQNSTMAEDTCPTTPGLSREGGFDPGLNWSSLREDPTGNWHVIGWLVCLLFLAVTWIVSIVLVTRHLMNYYEPRIQRHKLRVILFPPVYSTLLWFSYLRYDYSTTINFFATVFEAFAVFNLFEALQAYLQPYRDEAGDLKEPKDTKLMFIWNLHLNSMWGMHYRIITDILVFQYPIWSLIDSFISIFAELRGRYCEGVYSFKGAYVYLTIIDFTSLSIILTALFTYLDVYHREWQRGNIKAHGMFWCVKGPIMVNFYFGEILLTILTTVGVIKGTDGSHGSIAWPADAVKNGLYVIIVCFVMFVVSFMMLRFFGPRDNIQRAAASGKVKKMGYWRAFWDAYIAYIPEFFYSVLCCGADSYRLARKRRALQKRKKMEAMNGTTNTLDPNSNPTDHLLENQQTNNSGPTTDTQHEGSQYQMEALNSNNNNNNNNNQHYQPSSQQYHQNASTDYDYSNTHNQFNQVSAQPQPAYHQAPSFPEPYQQNNAHGPTSNSYSGFTYQQQFPM